MATITRTKEKIVGEDGFQVVSNRESRRVVLYSDVYCKWFSEKWNLYFESLYNKNINFQITPRSQPYFTPMDCRTHLDVLLQALFPESPTVLDLTCGVGGDITDMVMRLRPAQSFCVDYMADEEHMVLNQNLQNLVEAFPAEFPEGKDTIKNATESDGAWDARISIHKKTASKFLKEYGAYLRNKKKKCTSEGKLYKEPFVFMYADPSWNGQYLTDLTTEELDMVINAERTEKPRQVFGNYEEILENEATPIILMNYLATCIVKPAIKAGVPIDVLCIKVRWEITQQTMQKNLQLHPDLMNLFVVLYSVQAIPNVPGYKLKIRGDRYIIEEGQDKKQRKTDAYKATKGMFHWIVLKRVDYKYIPQTRSELYEEEVIQSHEVYVEEGTFVKPFKPRYGDSLPFPTVKTKEEFEELDDDLKKTYRKFGPARTWDMVELEDINTFYGKLTKLKEDYKKGNEEIKKKTKKKIQDIFELCKQYTQNKTNRMKADNYEAIQNLKELVTKLQEEINEGFTTVKTTSKKESQKLRKKSHLDDTTLELLHQLHVIFET
jgi:hypothetical protein